MAGQHTTRLVVQDMMDFLSVATMVYSSSEGAGGSLAGMSVGVGAAGCLLGARGFFCLSAGFISLEKSGSSESGCFRHSGTWSLDLQDLNFRLSGWSV